ncbi:hypothetical protein [Duganella sp. HH105]|uniref:hypothetical protein n=1 Tax=Duganella sp. HH105 TaxID=1781067 RepID=UPI000892F979|nr:hypothetical protein [Duganella sp. HH105]OEZ61653.1 hypothetical protein DUGA6_21030 [Duganella sp. HH105]
MKKMLPARQAVLLSSLLLTAGAASADTGLLISNPKTSNDGTYVYYEFDYTGAPNFVRVFIDTDRNATKGYTKGDIGSEFMVENGVLFKYSGVGKTDWKWQVDDTNNGRIAGYSAANGRVRLMIKRSSIGADVSAAQADDLVFDIQEGSTSHTTPKLTHTYTRVTVPTLERFELVTSDGLQQGAQTAPNVNPWSPNNDWGGHMSRVATTADGTVYMLNLVLTGEGGVQEGWQLRKRTLASGTWEAVASGPSLDEAHLLLSPITGKVYVIAHPEGKPAIGVEPSFTMQAIPGNWSQLTRSQRHYGNAGIGENGQICLKASWEGRDTGDTYTQYNCTAETLGEPTFAVGTFDSKRIGERSVYDYIFPGVANSLFFTSSQLDLTKEIAGYPRYTGNSYVFNGVKGFVFPSGRTWDVMEPLGVNDKPTATVAPELQQIDAYVDTKGRAFSIALKRTTDGNSSLSQNYFDLSVTDPVTGRGIYRGRLQDLSSGSGHIVEDAHKNLYLIWSSIWNSTVLKVFRLTEGTDAAGAPAFSLSLAADLTNSFALFDRGWEQMAYAAATGGRALYLASPRGGTARSGSVDGYLNACATEFDPPVVVNGQTQPRPKGYNADKCFGDQKKDQMKLIYFRIRLPD